jgi:hypothetical protein
MHDYNESELKSRIEAALKRVRQILDHTRNPQLAEDVPHVYDDKYALAEFLGRAAAAALVQCLASIGLAPGALDELRGWAQSRAVTLRLKAKEDCKFLREESRKVESATETVTETRSFLGKSTRSEKVVTTVTEYFWGFDFAYEIVAFQGSSDEEAVKLLARGGSVEIKTAAKTTPRPKTVIRPVIDVDLTWLLAHLDGELRASFAIDRTGPECHTPRRNPEVEAALQALGALAEWCGRAHGYFLTDLFSAQVGHGLDLAAISDAEVFVPVLPLLEAAGEQGVRPLGYLHAFLEEEQRSLASKRQDLAKVFPGDGTVITAVEAGLLVTLLHAARVCLHFADGVAYIEDMLRSQLVAAIGKEVTPAELTGYMDFHARKLFKPAFRPRPFSHAVRRTGHDPEGAVAIEAEVRTAMPEPVSTVVAWSEAARPMSFALDASTRVSFLGDRYLHAYVAHQFSGASGLALSLVARARQFSSFILLVGRIASADTFEPKLGIIVQNKDLLKIPLMLEPIPTPKEFRDAIASLSPEQQRFAKAFRAMQLESTLFAVCAIQIKPQLEKLLKLPPDSLTKEIKLTQELSSLFIDYQIPSDLLSYDGPEDAAPAGKLATVKEYVARMLAMLDASKARELEEAREREALRLAEMNRTPVPPMPPPMMAPQSAPRPAMMMGAISPAPGGAAMSLRGGGPPPMPPPTAAPPPPPPPPAAASAPPEPPPADAATAATPHSAGVPQPAGPGEPGDPGDLTRLPVDLDRKLEQLDEDGAVRPTILKTGDVWTRSAQKGLLAAPAVATLRAREHEQERHKAFDLLDALTKSGALSVDHASLHVVIAATHCFDRTLLDTVIQGNVNPIEKLERSLMIVATTIHGLPAVQLIADDQRERFLTYSRRLGD